MVSSVKYRFLLLYLFVHLTFADGNDKEKRNTKKIADQLPSSSSVRTQPTNVGNNPELSTSGPTTAEPQRRSQMIMNVPKMPLNTTSIKTSLVNESENSQDGTPKEHSTNLKQNNGSMQLPSFIQALYNGLKKTISDGTFQENNFFLQPWELVAVRGKLDETNGSHYTKFDLTSVPEKHKFHYVEIVYDFSHFEGNITQQFCNFTCCNEDNECEILTPVSSTTKAFLHLTGSRDSKMNERTHLTLNQSSCEDGITKDFFTAVTPPLLVLYPDEKLAKSMYPYLHKGWLKRDLNSPGERRKETGRARRKLRRVSTQDSVRDTGSGRADMKCRLFGLSATGEDMGWTPYRMVEPGRLELGYCGGNCSDNKSNVSTSARIRSKYREGLNETERNLTKVPQPCCVPKKVLPQTVILERDGSLLAKNIPDARVESCECV